MSGATGRVRKSRRSQETSSVAEPGGSSAATQRATVATSGSTSPGFTRSAA